MGVLPFEAIFILQKQFSYPEDPERSGIPTSDHVGKDAVERLDRHRYYKLLKWGGITKAYGRDEGQIERRMIEETHVFP